MKTTITLYDSDSYRSRCVPENLVKMIKWLTGLLEEVPSEHHDNVTIEFDSYDDTSPVSCLVAYDREETEPERIAREERELDLKKRLEEREREHFAKLKAKFEP